jgi:hypothetical protein
MDQRNGGRDRDENREIDDREIDAVLGARIVMSV